jgi:hypothetical protein
MNCLDLTNIKDTIYCPVCLKKGKSHVECYKRYCIICSTSFPNAEKYEKHVEYFHKTNWCRNCKQAFKHIQNHMKNYH